MKLLIVIVNYKTAGLTVDCLRSLAAELPGVAGVTRVCVTDNASGDGSIEQIQPEPAPHLIRAVVQAAGRVNERLGGKRPI